MNGSSIYTTEIIATK